MHSNSPGFSSMQQLAARWYALTRPSQEPESSHPGKAKGRAHGLQQRLLESSRGNRPETRSTTDVKFKATSLSERSSQELRITTDEGDVVTLSGSSEREVTYGSLKVRTRTDEGTQKLKASFQEISIDRDFSVSVEGDLNEQELADIRKLVGEIGDDLKQGPQGSGFPVEVDGDEYASLSGFSLSVEREVSLTRLHLRHRERTFEQPVEQPLDQPAEPEVADVPADEVAPVRSPSLDEIVSRLFQAAEADGLNWGPR